ncbi:hypothetical protein [Roseobacter sp. HKCCA0434]|uniref:hypothetical protein n=1 Tax=Roseobacter sp. HKCCA0434 TaxID=3079297 RepID=UPI002905987C|nr:hypothetical protein [Roseobacter sp. HKCCA0434]
MSLAFANPHYLRALLTDAETGSDLARLQDRWAYTDASGVLCTHPTQEGAERLAARERRNTVPAQAETPAPATQAPDASELIHPASLARTIEIVELAYSHATDPTEQLRWLLCDLRHFADHHGLAFGNIDRSAHQLYRDEQDARPEGTA